MIMLCGECVARVVAEGDDFQPGYYVYVFMQSKSDRWDKIEARLTSLPSRHVIIIAILRNTEGQQSLIY